jgi:hypothetical protein
MNVCLKIALAIVYGTIVFVSSPAQTPPSEQTSAPATVADEDEQFRVIRIHNESENKTDFDIDFRIVGSGWYVPEHVDAIKGRIGFEVAGSHPIEPKSVYLSITTSSSGRSKYGEVEILTIFVDGKVLLSGDLKHLYTWASSFTVKTFTFAPIPYRDFLKIIEAEKVTFQIGETKADLAPKELQRLKDLNAIIEKSPVVIQH